MTTTTDHREAELGALSGELGDKERVRRLAMRRLFGESTPAPIIGERYELIGVIGRGGLGRVYRARDTKLRREVAIKLVTVEAGDEADPQRLFREALALARLSHPGIVAVHDVGRLRSEVYIAMELVDGSTLETWLGQARRGWREILPIFREAGRALEAAHQVGLVHGDFKPANVMIDRDRRVRVLDFGLAREPTHETTMRDSQIGLGPGLTRVGGTPGFMPPEQYDGAIDARSDEFAFCVSLFRGIFGVAPFDPSPHGIDDAHLRSEPARRSLIQKRVPAWLRSAVLRGLRPEPAERFGSMPALLQALTPPSRRVWSLGAIGALTAGAAIGWATMRDPCQFDDSGRRPLWSDERRMALDAEAGARLDVLSLATSVRSYSEEWFSLRDATCQAHRAGELGDALYDLRLACLRQSWDRFGYLLDQLEHGEQTDWSLVPDAVGELAIIACDDDRGLLAGRDPEQTQWEITQSIHRGIGEATVHLSLGDSRAHLERLLALQRVAPDPAQAPGVTLWLSMHVGAALNQAGRFEDAETRLRSSMLEARRWGRWPEAEGKVLLHLAEALAQQPGRGPEAVLLAEQAVATLEASPDARAHMAAGWRALAHAQHAAGHDEHALASIDRALQERSAPVWAHQAPVQARIARCGALNLRGLILEALARPIDAELAYREALTKAQEIGFSTLAHAHVLNNLGLLMRRLGRPSEALDLLRRSASMKSELGLAAEAAATVMNIANTHLAAGQHEAAVKSYDDALSRLATATDSRQEELILYNRAIALHALGRFDDALRDYGRVVSSLSTAAAPTPQRLYPALVGRGSTRLARGDAAMAETDYEAALRIEPATAVAYDRAELRFGLAQAVSARDAARARGLAAEALELARASGDASLIASIEGWQRAALGDSSPAVAKGGVAVASSSD